jgi:RPA family protein
MKRPHAKKILIEQINNSEFVKAAGWDPNYITINNEKISYVNVMGIIVEVQDKAIVLDDGTGTMPIRFFSKMPTLTIGKAAQVIGRINMVKEEKFLAGEMIGLVHPDWLKVRKNEVSFVATKPIEKKKVETKQAVEDVYNLKDDIIDEIKKLDSGSGVDMEVLTGGSTEKQKAITSLMEEGEVFEIMPGKVKVLE